MASHVTTRPPKPKASQLVATLLPQHANHRLHLRMPQPKQEGGVAPEALGTQHVEARLGADELLRPRSCLLEAISRSLAPPLAATRAPSSEAASFMGPSLA